MPLAIFEPLAGDAPPRLGVVTPAGVVAVDGVGAPSAGAALRDLISDYGVLDGGLEGLAGDTVPVPLDTVRLRAPLASPAKILCSLRVTLKPDEIEQRHVFLKSPGSAIGDGGEVVLPHLPGAEFYTHNLCLAVVIGRRCRDVAAAEWREAVFGYTAMVDITGRTGELSRWKDGKSSLGSSCDTFGPLGPWIVPRDVFDEDGGFALSLSCNGQVRQEARIENLDERIGTVIELASTIMTLKPGDVIAVEVTPDGQGPLQHGDQLRVELDGVGRLSASVRDPWGRNWDPEVRVARDADHTDGQPAPPATA
jgi:2-keto-4-pentenoate hydratase/2-oxohepta-3-ene-1,7-dioic acid hydratase in catechol pathway